MSGELRKAGLSGAQCGGAPQNETRGVLRGGLAKARVHACPFTSLLQMIL